GIKLANQPELLSQGACPAVRGQKRRLNPSGTCTGPTCLVACLRAATCSPRPPPSPTASPYLPGEPRTYNAGPLLSIPAPRRCCDLRGLRSICPAAPPGACRNRHPLAKKESTAAAPG